MSRAAWRGSEIQPAVRCAVYLRGGGRCAWCSTPLTRAALTIDHVIPRAEGGTNHPSNLVPACDECNRERGGGEVNFADHLETRGQRLDRAWRRVRRQLARLIDREAGRRLAARWYPWSVAREERDRQLARERMRRRAEQRREARAEGLGGVEFPFGALEARSEEAA